MRVREEKPLVSIVTPSYNQGMFIERTIESVISQDYPRIEHIVVDGGSADNTLEVLRKYESRLKWVSERDDGQTDAINKGFRMSKGTVLAWLNSDDIYYPGAVSRAVKALRENPEAEMVYGKGNYINTDDGVTGEYPTGPFDYERFSELNFICQPSVFFRREALEAVGELDRSLNYVMDYDLWIRVARKFKVLYVPEVLAALRIHPGSKTTAQSVATYAEMLSTSKKYFGKAGGALIYGYAFNRVKSASGAGARKNRLFTAVRIITLFIKEYARLNGTLPFKELKALDKKRIKAIISGI